MPIYSRELRLTYLPVPKVGTSTMRVVLKSLELGIPTEDVVKWHRKEVEAGPRTSAGPIARAMRQRQARNPDSETLVLVRDPARRFLSAFHNKISSGLLAQHSGGAIVPGTDLPSQPDLETFLGHVREYRQASWMIRKHFLPLTHYLGDDLGVFDHVYMLERFPEFSAFIESRLGAPVKFPHVKRQDMSWVDSLPRRLLRRVERRVGRDYKLLHNHYGPDMPGITVPAWLRKKLV
ncbi:MAG: sulfotransferase family 2 domain-containing protein [Pseudomonadota bacterium]